MANQAIVGKIKTMAHPNADRIQLGIVFGEQVIVGKDIRDGVLGVYFDTNLILSDEFCTANNLYRNLDENGKNIGGFFDPEKPRVRAQSFRGQKSYGYWARLDSLKFTGYDVSKLQEGDTFDTLNDIPICKRYYVPRSNKKGKKDQEEDEKLRSTPMFRMHYGTEQWKYRKLQLQPGDLVTITEKIHGTAGRYGHVILPKPKSFWKRLFYRKQRWGYLNGTRRTILGDGSNTYYEDNSFRDNVVRGIELHKGETIYYEIVGWETEDRPIMPTVQTSSIKDKAFHKQYGDTMIFKYGCPRGTQDIYVYRITRANEDGVLTELSWSQLKRRCSELGLKHVPELKQFIFDGDLEALDQYLNEVVEGVDLIDPSHVREGVVIRVDSANGYHYALKHKSWTFYVLEGIWQDTGELEPDDVN